MTPSPRRHCHCDIIAVIIVSSLSSSRRPRHCDIIFTPVITGPTTGEAGREDGRTVGPHRGQAALPALILVLSVEDEDSPPHGSPKTTSPDHAHNGPARRRRSPGVIGGGGGGGSRLCRGSSCGTGEGGGWAQGAPSLRPHARPAGTRLQATRPVRSHRLRGEGRAPPPPPLPMPGSLRPLLKSGLERSTKRLLPPDGPTGSRPLARLLPQPDGGRHPRCFTVSWPPGGARPPRSSIASDWWPRVQLPREDLQTRVLSAI